MKFTRLNDYQVGLVFRNDAYNRTISSGTHLIRLNEEVYVYDINKPFVPLCDLGILLQDEHLAGMLEVITVEDNQLGLLWENGLFKSVLGPGKHPYWKGITVRAFRIFNLDEMYVPEELNMNVLIKTEFINHIRVYSVESYERGLLLIDGNFKTELSPGVYYFWKNIKQVIVLKADLRQQQIEVNGQEIMTADKANLRLNFAAHYKITDIQKALLSHKEFEKQLYVLLQLAYREYISNMKLDELLEKKEAIAGFVRSSVEVAAKQLGVEISFTGIKDIILPGEVKEIMNQVLVAEKKAQANIIMRREETASTRSLLNTARLMEENQMLFKLKEMEYVEKIAEKINSISVGGDNRVLDQLRQIFSTAR